MAVKAVTHLDLANLENKITEQQTKIRHDQRSEFGEKLFIVDELKTESKVNTLIMVNMQKDIEEIKTMLKELTKSLPNTYVSKDELSPIREKQKLHDEIISRVVWGIVITFISLITGLVGLSKYM